MAAASPMLLTRRRVISSAAAFWRWLCASRLTGVPHILGHIDGVLSGAPNYREALRRHLWLQNSRFGKSGKGLVSLMSTLAEKQTFKFYSLSLLLNFSRSPGFVEPSFQWAVKAKDHKPTFAWNCLNPIVFKTGRSFGTEIDIDGAVGIGLKVLAMAAHARELLIGLQERARLIVVDDDRPKILYLDIRRQTPSVCPGTAPSRAP